MALSIRTIPTLYGKEARDFELEARKVEANPNKIDCSREAKIVRDYLNPSISDDYRRTATEMQFMCRYDQKA